MYVCMCVWCVHWTVSGDVDVGIRKCDERKVNAHSCCFILLNIFFSVANHGSSWFAVVAVYLTLMFSALFHCITFYKLMGSGM